MNFLDYCNVRVSGFIVMDGYGFFYNVVGVYW